MRLRKAFLRNDRTLFFEQIGKLANSTVAALEFFVSVLAKPFRCFLSMKSVTRISMTAGVTGRDRTKRQAEQQSEPVD